MSRAAPSLPLPALWSGGSLAVPRLPCGEPQTRGVATVQGGNLRQLVRPRTRGHPAPAARRPRYVRVGAGGAKLTTMTTLTSRNRTALTTCRRIRKRINNTRQKNKVTAGQDGKTIDLLLDKADKTARAVMILGTRGYPEDSLILARSLASLTIDLNYLSAKDADRFVTFRATGREARRRMAEQCGFTPPDAAATDWDDVKARAK